MGSNGRPAASLGKSSRPATTEHNNRLLESHAESPGQRFLPGDQWIWRFRISSGKPYF
jgi:hypothetical protein